MQAIQLENYGIEHLKIAEVPTPEIGENEVLVRTTAVSLQYLDLLTVENTVGLNIPLPFIPVSEGVGVVESVGKNVTRWKKGDQFYPEDILDYIYAVLHSPSYREKYKEFLKIDFPRVPYPTNPKTFWKLVALGKQIREIHLLESPVVEKFITQYPSSGNNEVTKPYFEENYEIVDGDTIINLDPVYPMGRVYINETQYFQQVPEVAWNFYIGGYQPAQKWLKDRKGRVLDFEDIMYYQKIIVALTETNRLMKDVDNVISF